MSSLMLKRFLIAALCAGILVGSFFVAYGCMYAMHVLVAMAGHGPTVVYQAIAVDFFLLGLWVLINYFVIKWVWTRARH